jgi:hypothetical protein
LREEQKLKVEANVLSKGWPAGGPAAVGVLDAHLVCKSGLEKAVSHPPRIEQEPFFQAGEGTTQALPPERLFWTPSRAPVVHLLH